MKKIFPIVALLLIIFGFSACSNKTSSENAASKSRSEIVNKPKQTVSEDEINQNKTNWEKKTKSLKVVHDKSTITDLATFPKTLDNLKKNNDYVISGRIVNLQQMTDEDENAMTKATILVTQVIDGNQKLENHKIKVVFTGGITKNPKSKKVYVQKTDTPIPEIGTEIITGIKTNSSKDADKKEAAYLKTNGLGGSDSFKISVPEYNLWVKANGAKKYVLNNPELSGKKKTDSNKSDAKDLKDLTSQLNNNYN